MGIKKYEIYTARAVCLILELYLYGMCKVNHEVNRYVI